MIHTPGILLVPVGIGACIIPLAVYWFYIGAYVPSRLYLVCSCLFFSSSFFKVRLKMTDIWTYRYLGTTGTPTYDADGKFQGYHADGIWVHIYSSSLSSFPPSHFLFILIFMSSFVFGTYYFWLPPSMQLYHLFGGFWALNFLHAVSECVIAGAIASWYWVHDKKVFPFILCLSPLAFSFLSSAPSLTLISLTSPDLSLIHII